MKNGDVISASNYTDITFLSLISSIVCTFRALAELTLIRLVSCMHQDKFVQLNDDTVEYSVTKDD